jgi:hypothetical protein
VRDVARRDRTRRKNCFFEKSEDRKAKIKRSKKRKTQKVESKIFSEILSLEKQIAEAKTLQSFQSA